MSQSYRHIPLGNILFLDIETVPQYEFYEEVPEEFKELWQNKTYRYKTDKEDETDEEMYLQWAGIPSEFAKVICISVGAFRGEEFFIKSFADADEKTVLNGFKELLDKSYTENPAEWRNKKAYENPKYYLCAHNGIEFDFPFMARRMMIHNMELPQLLDVAGTKSWNNKHLLDTMEMWKFGDQKEKTSLKLLATCLSIPSPKDDISGKDVSRVFYKEKDLERIKNYCQKDVVALARIYQKFAGFPMIAEEKISVR